MTFHANVPPNFSNANRYSVNNVGRCKSKFHFIRSLHRYISEGIKGSDVVDIYTLIVYCISTVNTQHMQRPDVLVQLGYIWRHVSAVKQKS